MFTRRIGAACDTAQKLPDDRQSLRPMTLMVRLDSDRQKLFSARQLLVPLLSRHRLYTSTWPLIDDVARVAAEACHLGVVADLHDERVGRGAVAAGLEQQRVALAAHLVVDLLGIDGVDGRLDVARRHARVEHRHVRPEVRVPGGRGRRRLGDTEPSHRESGGKSETNGERAVRRHRRPAFRWRGRTAHSVINDSNRTLPPHTAQGQAHRRQSGALSKEERRRVVCLDARMSGRATVCPS